MKPARLLFGMVMAAILAGPATAALGSTTAQRPNFIFIFIDDMGYADLSCFGGKRVQTTEIDRLAGEGLRFTQFYVNSPICSPSRVAVTTGQYPSRWQITSFLATRQENQRRGMVDWLDPRAQTLARHLAEAGYHTAHVGKWHMGGQREIDDAPWIQAYGFATSLTNFEGLGERVLPIFEPLADGRAFNHGPTRMSGEVGLGPIHWINRHENSAVFVDRAIREIQAAVAEARPFYLNLWPDDVHTPMQAPPNLRGDGSPGAHYVGVLKELDRQLGRLFDHVRSQPALRDNTVILLASDNGPEEGFGSAGELRGHKCVLYEGGIRSPLIVWSSHVPAALRGSQNDRTVLAGVDLPPSLLSIAGVKPCSEVSFDGLDMSDALLGRSTPRRERPVMWVRPPDRPGPRGSWPDLAIRDGDWKLLVERDGSRPELFNIAEDPNEANNLAEAQPQRVRKLSATVIEWEQSVTRNAAE